MPSATIDDPHLLGERDERRCERALRTVGVDAAGEARCPPSRCRARCSSVCRRLANPAPASSIATRTPVRPQRVERRGEDLVVLDRLVLGDLDHHPRRVAVHEQRRARARWPRDANSSPRGTRRRAAPAALAGRCLMVVSSSCTPSSSLDRLGEPFVRWAQRQRMEPGERLHPHGPRVCGAPRSVGRPWTGRSPATNRSISPRRASSCLDVAISSRRSC